MNDGNHSNLVCFLWSWGRLRLSDNGLFKESRPDSLGFNPLIGYSIPLFTIGPHPIVLGLYLPLAGYLLYVGQMVIRNPSAINEFWLEFGTKNE